MSPQSSKFHTETFDHLALSITGHGVWDFDVMTGGCLYSLSWLSMLGYSENEIGESFDALTQRLHPGDRERIQAHLIKLFSGDLQSFSDECRMQCKDGSWKWVVMRCKVVEQTTDGEPLRVIGTQADISVRKQAEEMAYENAEHYRVLTEKLPLPMLIHVAGVLQYLNKNCVQLLGGNTAEEFIGTSIMKVIHPDYQAVAFERVTRILQGEPNVESVELKLIRKDGSETWIETTGIAIPFAGQQAIYVVGKDINERKLAEAEQVKRMEELESLYQLSNSVSTADSLEQVFETAMDAIMATLGASRVSILLFDAASQMRFKAWRGLSDTYRAAADGHSPWTAQELNPPPIFIADIEKDASFAYFRPVASAEGISAFGFVPLVQHGRLLGKFMVYFNEPHQFTEAEVRLARTISFHIAFAIERKLAEEAVRHSKDMLQMTLRHAPDAVFICSQDGYISYVNDVTVAMLGYSREELYAMTVFDLSPVDWRERYRKVVEQISVGNDRHIMEIKLIHKDGNKLSFELNVALLPNGQLYGSCRDISERKYMERELRIAATAFETQEGICVTNSDNIILKVNQAFTKITGYSAYDVLGKTPAILKSGKQDTQFYRDMWARLNRDKFWEGEVWNKRKDGTIYPERLGITAVTNHTDKITNYVATFTDITRQKKAEEEIYNLAFYDPLTKQPNRRLLFDRLQQSMAASARHEQYGAVIFIDLDYFKTLNDTKGHELGDLMLVEVARRLQSCLRDDDTVSRLGGDEFVVLVENLNVDAAASAAQAEHVAQKIRASLSQIYLLKDYEFHSTPSIGVALFRGHEESVTDLIKHADIAMYQAKSAGRNTVRFYDIAMQAALEVRMHLESALHKALSLGQFQLHYQIQVDSAHCITGVEALLRWTHPERGNIPPADFISLAEETGLILPIGEWVLQTACAQINAWSGNSATRNLRIAVNVSPVQFAQEGFVAQVQRVLQETGIDPACLKLELTESLMLNNVDEVISKMKLLKEAGVRFSMDDFGTGFSSLSYLKKLPLDQLKIDQSFVQDLMPGQSDKDIVQAIITMGEAFGLNIIAEGVETEGQLSQLIDYGCRAFQGYLFGKPMTIRQIDAILAQRLE
jgi:diguanylate cyclase (GGDEF)-like protein/PAS domain S-box-containing protein